jgi:hypothetical protein
VLADVAKNAKDWHVRIAASHQLVNHDLEEDLLMYIIHMLGGLLINSYYESEQSSAAETLLAYYWRYRTGKQGKAIRMYEGEYKGGYSDHKDDGEKDDNCCPHYDSHNDTTYTINFNPENT